MAIAGVDLLRLFRDRTSLFFFAVLPFLIIVVVGSSFPADVGLRIGVVDLDGSTESAELVAALDADSALGILEVGDRTSLGRDLRLQSFDGGIVIPVGFGDDLAAGRSATVSIESLPTSPVTMTLFTTVAGVVTAQGATAGAADFVAAKTGVEPDAAAEAVAAAADQVAPVDVVRRDVSGNDTELNSAFAFVAPGQLTLFVFVNSLAAGAALVDLRLLGIASRIQATPAGRRSVVGGVMASRMAFALAQGGLIVAFGALIFGVDWGDPMGAVAVLVAFSLVSVGAGVLMGTWASTPDQTTAFGVPIAITMAMLGGCMLPSFLMPEAVRVVGHATPHAWAMDGWMTLVFDGGTLADITTELAVLAGFAVALVGLALLRLRRTLA